MISIIFRCENCDFIVRGQTPRAETPQDSKPQGFDEAVRHASTHVEQTGHVLVVVGGKVAKDLV